MKTNMELWKSKNGKWIIKLKDVLHHKQGRDYEALRIVVFNDIDKLKFFPRTFNHEGNEIIDYDEKDYLKYGQIPAYVKKKIDKYINHYKDDLLKEE